MGPGFRQSRGCRGPQVRIGSSGVICETRTLAGAVIPAKAGIYSANYWKCAADGLDSRFRGNDKSFEGNPIPNDTTTELGVDKRDTLYYA
jgi:hypothetical protein